MRKHITRLVQLVIALFLMLFIIYCLASAFVRVTDPVEYERRVRFCDGNNLVYDRISEACVAGKRIPGVY